MIKTFLNYLQYEKRVSKHTTTAYHTDLSQFEAFSLHDDPTFQIHQAKYSHIRAWIISMVENKISERSINRKIAALKTFYKFLQRKKHVDNNPTQKLRMLKTTKTLPDFVKQNEIAHLFNEALFTAGFSGVRDQLILEVLYGTGIRRAELIHLKISDIYWESKEIKVMGKRGKERLIPLGNGILSILEKYLKLRPENSEPYLIVTDKGKQSYPVFIHRIVHKYLTLTTSVDKASPHVLRHTFASHLLNEGAELNAIKELLGHANLAATQIYTHNSLDRIKRIFEQAHPKS